MEWHVPQTIDATLNEQVRSQIQIERPISRDLFIHRILSFIGNPNHIDPNFVVACCSEVLGKRENRAFNAKRGMLPKWDRTQHVPQGVRRFRPRSIEHHFAAEQQVAGLHSGVDFVHRGPGSPLRFGELNPPVISSSILS